MRKSNKNTLMVIACVDYELDEHMHAATKQHSIYFERGERCTDQVELSGNEQMAAMHLLKQWRDGRYHGSAPEFAAEFIDRFLSHGTPAASMIYAAIRDGWELQIGRPGAVTQSQQLLTAAG